jgi:hypothetical protein
MTKAQKAALELGVVVLGDLLRETEAAYREAEDLDKHWLYVRRLELTEARAGLTNVLAEYAVEAA